MQVTEVTPGGEALLIVDFDGRWKSPFASENCGIESMELGDIVIPIVQLAPDNTHPSHKSLVQDVAP